MIRSMRAASTSVGGRFLPEAIGINGGVLGVQQPPEGLLMRRRGVAELLIDVAREQEVELFHAAAATPAQPAEFLRFDRGHSLRRKLSGADGPASA